MTGKKQIKNIYPGRKWHRFLLLCCIFFFTACPDEKDNEDDHYDPRNVTRIDDHIEAAPDIAVDSEGKVHLVYHGSVYQDPRDVWYTSQDADAEWSDPLNLSNSTNHSRVPQIAIDSEDNIHVIWEEGGEGNGRTMYLMKGVNSDWTDPVYITESYNLLPQIAIDGLDNVHVVGDGVTVTYRKKVDDHWYSNDSPDTIGVTNPELAISDEGDLFISGEQRIGVIELITRSANTGLWDREFISDNHDQQWVAAVGVGSDGTVYVSWTVTFTDQIILRHKSPNGTWSEIDSIPGMEGDPWRSHLVVDGYGLHVVWNAHTDQWDYDIYYQMRSHDGIWSDRKQISLTQYPSLNQGIFLNDNLLHIAWVELLSESLYGNSDVYYETTIPLE